VSDEHLGDEIHDLLDNRLSPAKSALAMAHLDACEECRTRWDELRAARDALKTSDAGIDLTFAQQLLDRDRMAQIASGEPRHLARAARPRDRRMSVAAVAVIAVLGVLVVSGYLAGAPDEVSLEFAESDYDGEPALLALNAQHMRTGDQLRSWVHPDWEETGLKPVNAKVLRASNGENILVASMLSGLDPMIITERHGRLSASISDYYVSVDLGHGQAYLVSDQPRQLVWQTGDVVISVTCSCPLTTLEAAASTFPAHDDPTFIDRVLDGLSDIADATTPGA